MDAKVLLGVLLQFLGPDHEQQIHGLIVVDNGDKA